MKFKHRDDEFLESKIEKLVFIESKQYRDMKEGPVYGKYLEQNFILEKFFVEMLRFLIRDFVEK